MNYLLFLFWIFFMILFHYLIKNDFSFIQKYLNKLFKYSPLFKEYLKKYLKTILYTFFTFIVGKTFEHLDMWVDLFFVSIWMLVDEKENINNENKKEIDNIIITRYDIERILNILNLEDNVKRIYINFCNPWPRGKHHKKRLTHIRQLDKYKQFLQKNGEIFFKTDDDSLFADSLLYFKQTGFTIEKFTYDLEKEENFWDNIVTEHEQMFMNEGIKIKAVIARLEE